MSVSEVVVVGGIEQQIIWTSKPKAIERDRQRDKREIE